jgi:hypothetical protein
MDADPSQSAAIDDVYCPFRDYLRTVNSRDGRPFEEKTIAVYCDPVKKTAAA